MQQFIDNCQVIAHTLTALLTEVLYEKYRGQLDEHYQSSSELKVKSGIFSDLTESSVLFCSFDFVME